MNEQQYKKLQKKNKLVKIDKRIFGDNALAIESILNSLIIKNRTTTAKEGREIVGTALETAADGETFLVHLNIGGGSPNA